MRKNNLCLILLLMLSICCAGCGKVDSNKYKKVAILKFTTHPALDELEKGFSQKLQNLFKNKNDSVIIEYYNADGRVQNAKSIAGSLNISKPDIIFVIGTPAAIQLVNTPSNIPIIYGAVADPIGAKIIPSDRVTGIQNAGENIIVKALSFIRIAFPNAKTIGTIYNPSEQNSKYVQTFMEKNSSNYGFKFIQVPITEISQITSSIEYLSNQVDVIYSANDNTVNSGIGSVTTICEKKNIPFVIGDLSTLSKGPLFAIGLEYLSMGFDLADITFKILNGAKITDFPPREAPNPQIWMNNLTKKKMGYIEPEGLEILINKSIN